MHIFAVMRLNALYNGACREKPRRNGKVQVSRSRNACSHYVTKGFRNPETGRPTTKVVEKLGNEEAIRARISGKLELG